MKALPNVAEIKIEAPLPQAAGETLAFAVQIPQANPGVNRRFF
jgi:hypothetical protein